MEDLQVFLQKKKYRKLKFKTLKTNHLRILAKINGTQGTFILDTGASNSCVDIARIEKFSLDAQKSSTRAAGAGAIGMETQTATASVVQLGRWKIQNFCIVVFDMSHVNQALATYKTKSVDGIIGADILLEGKAIIDYANGYLYLWEK